MGHEMKIDTFLGIFNDLLFTGKPITIALYILQVCVLKSETIVSPGIEDIWVKPADQIKIKKFV